MTERFYVSKGKIRDKQKPNDWFTVKEVCALLNKQEDLIKRQNDELNNLTEENEQLKQEHRQLQIDFNDLVGINTDYRELTYDLTDLIEDLGSEEMKRQMYEILKKSHISEFKEYAVEESKKYG